MLCCALLLVMQARAQTTEPKIYQGVQLSEVVIKDVRNGFDVEGFIEKVKKDTTFYKAFKTLKVKGFTTYNDISFYSKRKRKIASYNSISKQERKGNCRTMSFSNEKVKGNFYQRDGDYNYFTAELYDKLFFIHSKQCNENNIVGKGVTKNENLRISQLKELIFQPGKAIHGVPGIGSKLGIFEDGRTDNYDFSLSKKEYNGEWCYVFSAKPKKGAGGKVVIDNLETWFRESDNAIVARKYALSYNTLVYDFDVRMHVKLKMHKGMLVPYEVNYDGDWHFVGKKRENANFKALFTDFH